MTARPVPLAALALICLLGCGPSDDVSTTGASPVPTPGAPASAASGSPAPTASGPETAAQGISAGASYAPATKPDGSTPPAAPSETLTVEGLLNGGFEWICDGTTDPPKYGAYWKGAFVYKPGDPGDLIVSDGEPGERPAAEGQRFLRLTAANEPVLQKIVADPRWTEQATVSLSFRSRGGASLDVTLEDGPGLRTTVTLPAPEGPGWQSHELALGELFTAEHGRRPTPRLNLWLSCHASDGEVGLPVGGEIAVDVDDVSATIVMPSVSAQTLAREIKAQAHKVLGRWFLSAEDGGLGLVDPVTGYSLFRAFDVETGENRVATTQAGYHSIHTVLLTWLEISRDAGWDDEIAAWTPALERIVATLVERHFHPDTGLPQLVDLSSGKPALDAVVTVGAYVEFLTRAQGLLNDQALAAATRARIRTTADALLRLALKHDLPDTVFNDAKLNRNTGVFEGTYPNWFGHMPNRITPQGVIDVPRQFNTAWAIIKKRTFWYHLFKSPAAVMWAHGLQPRVQDLNGVNRAMSRYHRDWDASRYDLENDTDDHYGYLMEDLLEVSRFGGDAVPRALELITIATDHRLDRSATDLGETLWIQAIRLGTACAGDSPRAFKGLHDLYQLPADSGAPGAALPLYRDVLQELAANDYKGRQLTNSQFTESFFRHWEMVCICYKGTYQGDCRDRPLDQWDGDVGDIFGGPPMQGIEAQVWAYSVGTDAERELILARLGTLRHATESTLAREYGYLFGMPKHIAEQYQLPEKYITGLSRRSTIGLGYLLSWLHLLPLLLDEG